MFLNICILMNISNLILLARARNGQKSRHVEISSSAHTNTEALFWWRGKSEKKKLFSCVDIITTIIPLFRMKYIETEYNSWNVHLYSDWLYRYFIWKSYLYIPLNFRRFWAPAKNNFRIYISSDLYNDKSYD